MQTTLYGASVTLRTATDADIPELVRIRTTPEVYARWRGGDDLTASVTEDFHDTDEHMFVIEHADPVAVEGVEPTLYEQHGREPTQYGDGDQRATPAWRELALVALTIGVLAGGLVSVGGMESVWDYPRPPRLERTDRQITIVHADMTVVDSDQCWRVLETSHPPVYYVPRADVAPGVLLAARRQTYCEFKGAASYWDLVVGLARVHDAAWSYEDPTPAYTALTGALAFYPGRVDACLVAGEQVDVQPGDFYGGWITSDITGPFKGTPSTSGVVMGSLAVASNGTVASGGAHVHLGEPECTGQPGRSASTTASP